MRTVKIVDIAEQIRGVSYNPEDVFDTAQENTVPLLRANNIQDTGLNYDDLVYVQKSKVSPKQLLRQGDILVCASSGSRHLVGKAGHVYNDFGTFGAFCKVLRPNAQLVNRNYFAHYFQSPLYRRTIANLAAGANINNIKNEHLNELQIKLPCLQEQNTIARVFDKTNAIIGKRRAQLSCLNELAKSRFIEMFGDPVTNPKSWPVHQLSEYIQFMTSGSRGWARYFTDRGEYFITIKNVKNCRISLGEVQHVTPPNNAEAKRTKVQEGDLLISITADLGRMGVISKEIAEHGGYINQHLTCIRLCNTALDPLYVAYYMESDAGKEQFRAKNQSAVKAGLNFNSINSLRLLVPPLEQQKAFSSFIKQLDKSKFSVSQQQKMIDSCKRGIILHLTGRL